MRLVSRMTLVACIAGATMAAALPAAAEGALAFGIKNNNPALGVSYGVGYNYQTVEGAKYEALVQCLKQDISADIRAECKVTMTFRNACASIAWDPAAGEPGFGYAQGADRASAERQALDQCRATAGARRGACVVDKTFCDVTNNNVASAGTPAQLAAPAGLTAGGGARK